MKKITHRIAAAVALALGASVANAGTSTIHFDSAGGKSTKHQGSFEGSMSYDDVSHLLKIVLENTSAAKGYLTGFAFNVKGSSKAIYIDGDVTVTKQDEDAFDNLKTKKGLLKVKKFGKYEAGAGLDGKLAGNKKPARGVANGASREFDFHVSGAGASGLTAGDFLADPANMALICNFQLKKKGSDKVSGLLVADGGSTTPSNAPVPPTIVPDGSTSDDSSGSTTVVPAPLITLDLPGNNDGGDTITTNDIVPGDNGGGNRPGTVAVPLPPAAYSGLATLGLITVASLRKKFRGLLGA